MVIYTQHIETPVGRLFAGANDKGIFLLDFMQRSGGLVKIRQRIEASWSATFETGEHKYIALLEQQLSEYFSGSLKIFDLPLQFSGTPFQQKVWTELLQIPYGTTRTYLQQSRILGDEKAIRAVASTNGANGLAIVVPCHRIIGSNASLTGYAGGLAAKQYLLAHEQKHSGVAQQSSLF